MNKDALDYLFATGLVRSFRMSNDPDIDDDEIIRLQPKYMLQSARELADGDLELLRKSHKDIINDEAEIQQLTTQINIFQHAIQQSQNCPSVSGCPVLLRLRLPPAPTP